MYEAWLKSGYSTLRDMQRTVGIIDTKANILIAEE
jgi:hypothetical protein